MKNSKPIVPSSRNQALSNKWWAQTGAKLASSVYSNANTINNNQFSFWRSNFLFAQLYENIDSVVNGNNAFLSGLGSYQGFGAKSNVLNSKLTYNVVASVIDSATSKIAKARPKIKFLTSGANYTLQKKAKALTKYIDGIFYQSDIYKYATQMFKDSCIFGTGALKIYIDPHTNKINIDRVIVPIELIIDWMDGKDMKPTQMHQRKIIAREVMIATYAPDYDTDKGDKKIYDAIMASSCIPNPLGRSDEMLLVIESWHLPSIPGAKDGKHSISIDNFALLEEKYEENHFPFVFFRWKNRIEGFFGYGLAEELTFIQLAINRVHRMVTAAMEINCVPRVFVEQGSLLAKHKFSDAGISEYKTGSTPPIFSTMPAMTEDIYNYLETLYTKAYQIPGMSLQAATSQKPAGLNSAPAQREFQDINTERFSIQGNDYDQVFIDAAKIIINLSRKLYTENPDLIILARGTNKNMLKEIKWKDADLADDTYFMQASPASDLPSTTAGRTQTVTEWAQAGYIDRNTAMELMDIPDVDNYYNLTNSSINVVNKDLDAIVEDYEVRVPNDNLDLVGARKFAQSYLLKCIEQDVEDDRIQAIQDYINNIDNLTQLQAQNAAQAAAQAQQAGQALASGSNPSSGTSQLQQTQALPQTPPRSDLLPQNQVGPRGGERKT